MLYYLFRLSIYTFRNYFPHSISIIISNITKLLHFGAIPCLKGKKEYLKRSHESFLFCNIQFPQATIPYSNDITK